MKKFSSLLHNLILTPSRNTKIKLLQDYFKILDINRAYALAILSDQLSFQFIKASKLREIVYEQVDQNLFDFSYDYVGDLAETISLIWPTKTEGRTKNLSTLIENIKEIKKSKAKNILITHGQEDALVYYCKKQNLVSKPLSIQGRGDEEIE